MSSLAKPLGPKAELTPGSTPYDQAKVPSSSGRADATLKVFLDDGLGKAIEARASLIV
jgi:hypothetical protein